MVDMEGLKTTNYDAIRRHFDENSQKWYFSIVDSVGIITKSSDARNYWKVLKSRLKKTQNQLVTECNQHKMKASDGKFYLTDTGDEETILKIIKLISPEYVPSFRLWFDELEIGGRNQGARELFPSNLPPSPSRLSYPHIKGDEAEFMLMIDGYYTNDSVIVQAFTAGVSVENISISATSKTLTISGLRSPSESLKLSLGEFLHQELYWGKFSRTIKLPHEVEIEKIEATEHHGLLTIKLPMKNLLYNKKVKIESIK